MNSARSALRIVAVLVLGMSPMGPGGMAQSVNCEALKARIDASSGAGARAGQYSAALRQQQYELQRTQAYSNSLGCNSNLLFDNVPADCDAIASRIERMQENIAQLREQSQGGGDDDYRRRALAEQYNAYCAGTPADAPTDPSQGLETMPIDPDAPPQDDGSSDGGTRPHRVRALCVRDCDGGFFPITDDASSGSLEQYDHLCKALCPNAKASLYTAAPSAGIETAVAADGTPYTSLPAAFKFQKSFDATCSCKPPHQSWVQALAEAEKLIQSGHGDVTVTQKMSDAMSRPALPGQGALVGKALPKQKLARKAKMASPPAASPPNLADQGTLQAPDAFGGDLTQQLRRDGPTL